VQAIREKLKQRGARGIIGLQRVFKIMDDDNSKSLCMNEFKKAIHDFRIDIPDASIQLVFSAFDSNRDNSISYDEFLRVIRGPMNKSRRALVERAYKVLDKNGNGIIDIEDIKGVYNASKHPDVTAGKKTEDQILLEFLETFETHHNVLNDGHPDGQITMEEFVEYYTNIAASIDNDEYFALMMNNAWNLDGKKVTKKGWATASPQKANKKVGEAHQGYDKSRGADNMVVQRSGMVSSDNPLSGTKQMYSNNYGANRTMPSVANTKKVNNDQDRGTYMRSGEVSANNPFESGKQYYSEHKGK
jgi:Ca2+-binding EF-hand superfamily protein